MGTHTCTQTYTQLSLTSTSTSWTHGRLLVVQNYCVSSLVVWESISKNRLRTLYITLFARIYVRVAQKRCGKLFKKKMCRCLHMGFCQNSRRSRVVVLHGDQCVSWGTFPDNQTNKQVHKGEPKSGEVNTHYFSRFYIQYQSEKRLLEICSFPPTHNSPLPAPSYRVVIALIVSAKIASVMSRSARDVMCRPRTGH